MTPIKNKVEYGDILGCYDVARFNLTFRDQVGIDQLFSLRNNLEKQLRVSTTNEKS